MRQEEEEGKQALVVSAHDFHRGGADRRLFEGRVLGFAATSSCLLSMELVRRFCAPEKLGCVCNCLADHGCPLQLVLRAREGVRR